MGDEVKFTQEMCLGAISKSSKYSTHFDQNFNLDGSPDSVTLENIFNSPQDNIDDIVGYAKYCYRKHGIITRTINIIRDFSTTNITFNYPKKNPRVRECVKNYANRIGLEQLMADFVFEMALTGNLACYDRDGVRVDIYPINKIKPIPLVVNNKQLIAYKNDRMITQLYESYGDKIDKEIESAYPKEILDGSKKGDQYIMLDPENAYFAKINSSQYESYGISFIMPAFEDLAHKSLLKEAEKATANDIIDKIMLVQIGDKDNKPSKKLIDDYTNLLNGLSGSVRLTVPYYVNVQYVEPSTNIFGTEKFVEIDTDILNTLGISLSLIRGESGGNYSEGIINFSGLVKTIQNIQRAIQPILTGLIKAELKRNGFKEEYAPTISFGDIVIDKDAKMQLVQSMFTTAGLPYRVMYEEAGYDFDAIKIMREEENEEKLEEVFKVRTLPFYGDQGTEPADEDEGGAPKKPLSQRKSEPTQSNNKQPRPNADGIDRSA